MENQKIADELMKLTYQIAELRKGFEQNQSMGDWITRDQAMKFLGYQNTTMRELEKKGELTFSKVGRKKFIQKQEIIEFIERGIED
jgi:excisionase family DNA binding protein